MNGRRGFLTAAAMSAISAEAAAAGEDDHGTIYIPERHRETDRGFLLDFLEKYSFAMVITASPRIRITNVPTLLDRTGGGWGKLWWHLAKANPQNEAMKGEAVVVFRGPHGYISPNWYEANSAVPTWNFAVVHVTGRPKRIDDDRALAAGLRRLVEKNETVYGGGTRWSFDKLPESYLKGMRQGIVPYEMTIDQVEAKFKLGQDRSAADREGMLEGLGKGPREPNLLELSRAYFARAKRSL